MKTRTNTIVPPPDPSTNRSGGYGYNEIGAVTSDGSYAFTYDALGQPLSKEYNGDINKLEYYVYTPSDERIGVQRGTWWWWSVRDESGKVLRQYKSSTTNPAAASLWVEDFVWRDGLLLGSQRPVEMGGRRHFHLDHLGTPRLITSDAGQMVSYHDYYPFGDEHFPIPQEVPGGFDREEPMAFTGQERDYAGGMGGEDGHAIDDMHARDYTSTIGRFFSPDPVLGNLLQPQSWNRYAYVSNNPLNFDDPLGLAAEDSGKTTYPGNVECPQGTEGVTCFTTTRKGPGPVPQLPGARTTTWYESNVEEFERARAKPLLLTTSSPSDDPERDMEKIVRLQHCAEGTIAPLVVGGGAIVAGGYVAYTGLVLTGAAVSAAGPSFGTSLILVPVGASVVAGGGYLMVTGGSILTNTVNNWLGTKLPSASRSFPKYFPEFPPPDSHPCSEH